MSRQETLGFDRKLELAWLDAAAAAATRGETRRSARQGLMAMLSDVIPGDKARSEAVTVMGRIWLGAANPEMWQRALQALREAHTPDERLAVHWAMCAGTHPFFLDVASALGRLVRMQGEVSQNQVTRRVAEIWGDRSTLRRAVQRLCRTLITWGVLQETTSRGVYKLAGGTRAIRGGTARLLVEAVLVGGKNSAAPVTDLLRHSALFPFELQMSPAELRRAPEFEVDRLGLDVDMVRLTERRTATGL
jgi:hypothetical protein